MTTYLRSYPLENFGNIQHAFFTRNGGVSQDVYNSLNAAYSKGDKLEHILENRRRIARTFGEENEQLVSLRQIHSDIVLPVTRPFRHGDIPEGDGLVTNAPGLIIGVITADCVPVLLYDPSAGVVGAVHAGWRGATSRVLLNAIAEMNKLGAYDIRAAIGPCIWQESYEVGRDVYDCLINPDKYCQPGNDEKWQFDLPGYVRDRLIDHGVKQVSESMANTYADEASFFSYRRATHRKQNGTGHMISAIKLLY